MICFQDERATIQYLAAEQAIVCSWEGEVPSEQFQRVMLLKLQYMQAYSAKNWMLDIRYMQAISFNDQQWLMDSWVQELLKLSLRKIAVIQSFDVYNAMVVEHFLRYVPESADLEVQLFADLESSLAWIRDISAGNFEVKAAKA